jgi:hypothetical protein
MEPLRKVHYRRNVVNLQGELQPHIKIDGVIRLPAYSARNWLRKSYSRKPTLLRMIFPRTLSGRKMVAIERYNTVSDHE